MPIVDELEGRPAEFRAFCEARGIVYSAEVRRDLVAATLGSQLVLLAGPSGTGKSTAARIVAEYFSTPDATRTLDVRPLWTGRESLVGYFSQLAGEYVEAPGLQALIDLANSPDTRVPFAILEEANLSPVEIYFGDVVTALSGLSLQDLEYRLHFADPAPDLRGQPVPQSVTIGPHPRFVATINVDSTAGAPSPKVCGRGLTVLLEPPDVGLAADSAQAITAPAPPQVDPPGGSLVASPRAAWCSVVAGGLQTTLVDALKGLCGHLADDIGANYVSPRDFQRSVMFMAWHVALAEHDEGFTSHADAALKAAELALMHVVLPGLGSGQFGAAVESLSAHATPGGLLAQRLDRVLTSTRSIYGAPPDFWAALS